MKMRLNGMRQDNVILKAGLVFAAALGLATTSAEARSRDVCKRIAEFVDPFVELAMFNGVILIEEKNKIRRCNFGLANYETGRAFDEETRFRVASVSKTITDLAFARLVDDGVLTIDDPVAKFLPDFPKADAITIRQMINHRSGIPHTNNQEWGTGRISMSLDDIIARLAATPFSFEPGADSQYSNGGYAVMAKILEVVTDGSYGEAIDALVLSPLGMKNSGHIEDARRPDAKMAIGYEPGKEPRSRRYTRFYAAEMRPGGGSLYSTPSDILLLLRALDEGFVSDAALNDVLGFAPDEQRTSQGRSPGFVSDIMRDPSRNLTIISLANNYAIPSNWMEALLATLDGEDAGWLDMSLSDEAVDKDHGVFGVYASNFGGTVAVRWDDDAAYFEDEENQIRVAMPLLADGDFLLPIYYGKCRFDAETENVGCEILSGSAPYSYELTRAEE